MRLRRNGNARFRRQRAAQATMSPAVSRCDAITWQSQLVPVRLRKWSSTTTTVFCWMTLYRLLNTGTKPLE